MKAIWDSPENQQLWKVGKLLSEKRDGKTLAEHLINEVIERHTRASGRHRPADSAGFHNVIVELAPVGLSSLSFSSRFGRVAKPVRKCPQS
jgi:hypothetical protein